ncbi:uncharacterized protein LOC108142297 [Drosophila elegans]|uniref:uncharacterized protein LOC108142297 n=1 Tax=Drosophila elegans TaxID=30023 RepID=UPI0007E69A03|nr:uncharacterized protein LOC108142297 [Drosophila elegans]
MYTMRTIAVLKLSKGLMSSRLLAGSSNKGDSKKESCKSEETKKKEKAKKDFCGKVIQPTAPRCNKKSGDKDKPSEDKCKKN